MIGLRLMNRRKIYTCPSCLEDIYTGDTAIDYQHNIFCSDTCLHDYVDGESKDFVVGEDDLPNEEWGTDR